MTPQNDRSASTTPHCNFSLSCLPLTPFFHAPHRFSTAAVVVNVTKSINLGPSIPANVYNVFVSEGVPVSTSIFQTPVSHRY